MTPDLKNIQYSSSGQNIEKKVFLKNVKGIVSRDWGGLQMILLDRYIVVNISAGGSF